MHDPRVVEVLRHLQPPTGFKPWHGGASVQGSLRGVSVETAAWKPYPDRHCIWELALHVAYWNYAVWRRLEGEAQGTFPRSPSNWPSIPEKPTTAAWNADRRFVQEWHGRLVGAVERFDGSRLGDSAGNRSHTTYTDLITGILLHETYHAGQIQIMKRLAASAGLP